MWAWNHYVPFIQIDRNTQVFFLNTQYINWPLNDTSIWTQLPIIQTEAWTVLLEHISFKVPTTTTTTTTTSPVATTVSTVTVTKPIINTTLVIAIVVVVVIVAAVVAIIALRRR
jgi:hypothetical protein